MGAATVRETIVLGMLFCSVAPIVVDSTLQLWSTHVASGSNQHWPIAKMQIRTVDHGRSRGQRWARWSRGGVKARLGVCPERPQPRHWNISHIAPPTYYERGRLSNSERIYIRRRHSPVGCGCAWSRQSTRRGQNQNYRTPLHQTSSHALMSPIPDLVA